MQSDQNCQDGEKTAEEIHMAETTTQAQTLKLLLGEDEFDGQMAVKLESFLLFDNSITHGLDALERRWSDWATPDSLRRDIWENVER